MKKSRRIIKFEFLFIIIGVLLNSCNLNKNKVLNQDTKTEKKSELVYLEIRLPFESSNNWKGNDVNFKLTDNHGKIVESE
ncbi:hypothetical protein M4I21_16730 [Cellulophaga sp. 20_2_10]|uniref:hypothetical protein n=1 Tax=Cellulophaga sp. 20_2_10 TaxID=2942476 RepID=UPI00201AB627|nr:hypothetical protein [Cellulophaga sp. 20_2_10]MCL5247468.1 hypothetical protein [Cellulophaga sp. 20_2_10]